MAERSRFLSCGSTKASSCACRELLHIPLLQGRPRGAACRAGNGRLPCVLAPGAAHGQPQLRPLHDLRQGAPLSVWSGMASTSLGGIAEGQARVPHSLSSSLARFVGLCNCVLCTPCSRVHAPHMAPWVLLDSASVIHVTAAPDWQPGEDLSCHCGETFQQRLVTALQLCYLNVPLPP